jgi:hypothetical protein
MTISHSRTFLIGECDRNVITTFLLTSASSPVDVPASAPLPFKRDLQFFLLEFLHQPDYRISVQVGDLPDLSVRQPNLSTVSQPTPILITISTNRD